MRLVAINGKWDACGRSGRRRMCIGCSALPPASLRWSGAPLEALPPGALRWSGAPLEALPRVGSAYLQVSVCPVV